MRMLLLKAIINNLFWIMHFLFLTNLGVSSEIIFWVEFVPLLSSLSKLSNTLYVKPSRLGIWSVIIQTMKLNSSSLNIDLFCFNFNHISSFSWERIKSTNCWEFWWEENPFWIFKIHWFFFNKLFKIHWFRHHNHKQQKSKDIRKGAVDNWAKEQIPTPKLP